MGGFKSLLRHVEGWQDGRSGAAAGFGPRLRMAKARSALIVAPKV